MQMDAADLRVFEAVARLGGMSRAAEELHTVQSNVTSHIRQLEERLGTPLFHRHARGVDLTPAGQRLLPYALRVTLLLNEARRAVLDDGTPQGPLVIGSLETTAAVRLPGFLSNFVEAHPQVDLTLQTGTTCELLEQVLDQRLEGAFVCGPVAHSELEAEQYFAEELSLLTALQVGSWDQLARQGEVRIVVLRRGCSYRQRLEDILTRRGIPAPRVLAFGTLEAVLSCVASGMGVTLMPRSVVGSGWRHGRIEIHALESRDAFVETVFVRRRDGYISSALSAFLAVARSGIADTRLQVAAE